MTTTVTTARRSRRALAREMADYSTAAERDDLAALLVGRGAGDSLAAALLDREAYRALFRTR